MSWRESVLALFVILEIRCHPYWRIAARRPERRGVEEGLEPFAWLAWLRLAGEHRGEYCLPEKGVLRKVMGPGYLVAGVFS